MGAVKTVVIPVAGLGTRVLPATKSIPKELLPVVDRPLIDWVVEECREAGIERFALVTGRGKAAIEDYFDLAFELEQALEQKGKTALLETLQDRRPKPGEVFYTRQQAPLGLGHAIWCARAIVGDEPFAVALPDEIIAHRPGFLRQLVDAHGETGGNLVAVEEVPREDTAKYGVVRPEGAIGNLMKMSGMVEKPKPDEAPSNFRIIGRYILRPEIFDLLETQEKGAGGEIQLTDSMNALNARQDFHACVCEGEIFDCGSTLGFLKANAALGAQDDAVGDAFRAYLKSLL